MAEFIPDTTALVSAPSPMRRHRFVQITCLFATIAHTVATLICVYAFREGNFTDFTPARLMEFVPRHLILWRFCCLSAILSSISSLVFILAMREVLEEKFRFIIGVAVCLAVLACSQDLAAVSRMMVLFSDIALQGNAICTYTGNELVQIGWTLINQSITETFMVSSFLYGTAGMGICYCLSRTRVLPRSLAWAHLPVWLCMLSTAIATFAGFLPVAMSLMFAGNLGLSFLAAFSGVSIDSVLEQKKEQKPSVEITSVAGDSADPADSADQSAI
jgi:hypothetical protein